MTAFLKKLIRRLFTFMPAEKVLVLFLAKFPNSRLLKGITPSNEYYPAKCIRRCRRDGVNYLLDIHDYQNWLIYFYSESDSSFWALTYLKKGDIVLDIGGNIGQTALMMAKKLGNTGSIYSFEPYPVTFQQLEKNLSLNGVISNKIQAVNTALGERPGKMMMYQDCVTNSGANRMVPQAMATTNGNDQVSVPVSTIDIFVQQESLDIIDFIKIDVEGFEMQVLQGGAHTLADLKPRLFIELDDNNLKKQGSSAAELCRYLQSLGYTIYEEGKQEVFVLDRLSSMLNIYCTN
jgi:FkbM family methyltransferase